jgi:hypothetical protein
VNTTSRTATAILAILALGVVAIHGEDVWLSKSWTQWTPADCAKVLTDSPWAMKKEIPLPAVISKSSVPDYRHTNGGTMQSEPPKISNVSLEYAIQIVSAAPIRNALVRENQLMQKYDSMTEAQKKDQDSRDGEILVAQGDDKIVFQITFVVGGPDHKSTTADDRKVLDGISTYFGAIKEDASNLDAVLVMDSGERIKPSGFSTPKIGARGFTISFPRLRDGQPIIKPGQKSFTLEFQSPAAGSAHAKRIEAKFRLDKMNFEGKLAF